MAICVGKLFNFCFLYTSGNWYSPLDVLQPQCSDSMGKCIFHSVSGLGRMVLERSSSLHGSGNDCPTCFASSVLISNL